ncbi:MAG: acyl-CoA thioesterase II [Actinobacteria bacterium]|nr:acyl-CoA thioesterase II [Actinomycetota bacterium]
MPRTIDDLVAVLDLEQIEPDLFRGPAAQTRMQRTYGGQVLAQSVVAAYGTLPEGRVLHSLHAQFLEAGRADSPILYDVLPTRDGQHFSTRLVTARQGGRRIFTMGCSAQAPEPGLDHADPMPDVPAPEDCPVMSDVLEGHLGPNARMFGQWEELDVRYASGLEDSPPHHRASLAVWVRANGRLPDDPVLHQAVLAYLSDLTILSVSLIPHGLSYGPGIVAASLDHAMWFHRPVRADDWMLYDQISPSASGARGFSLGRIFSTDGLAATAAQEGLIRVVDARA